jgi:Flp pilus assembly pilin Flp
MLMLLNLMLSKLRNERGVVSVEWIILAVVIMVAIVAAFAPQFQAMLTAAVTSIGTTLTAQVGAAGGS